MGIIKKIAMAPLWLLLGLMALPFAVLVGIGKLSERFTKDAERRGDRFVLAMVIIPGLIGWVVSLGFGLLDWKLDAWVMWTGGGAFLLMGFYVVSVFGTVETRINQRFASWSERKRTRLLNLLLVVNLPLFIAVLGALIPNRE